MTIISSSLPDVAITDLSITERIFANLEDRLDAIVLTDGVSGDAMTARDFIERVQRLAGGLSAQGYGAGSTIAIMAPNMPAYCVVFHAVAWAGGTITTLNPTYTATEVAHQLKDAGADMLITIPAFLDVAEQAVATSGQQPVILIGGGDPENSLDRFFGEPLVAQHPVDRDEHIVVLPYSSGTTGLPKGVMLSHRNVVVNIDQVIAGADFRAGEVAVGFLPFFHIYGMNVIMNVHLAGGGSIVTMPRFDLELFLRLNETHRSRRMWIVPPVALALAKHPLVDQFDLSSVEQVFSGAAPLGADVSEAVAARLDCLILQGFGMTELSPVSHFSSADAHRAGASGRPLPNTECLIADIETDDALPPGSEGELWVRGPLVMKGYLNNPEATANTVTEDGWLRTGDIAYNDEDGYLFIVDRLKELIKYKGFQVAPAELEAVLVAHDDIIDAAVIGQPDPEAGELPVAYVVVGANRPSEADIKAHIAGSLAHYKQVHQVFYVDEIPKSLSGKILRRVLRDQLSQTAPA
ncbi:MAG: AMP-binding protein [Pseudomonadota bacterium]